MRPQVLSSRKCGKNCKTAHPKRSGMASVGATSLANIALQAIMLPHLVFNSLWIHYKDYWDQGVPRGVHYDWDRCFLPGGTAGLFHFSNHFQTHFRRAGQWPAPQTELEKFNCTAGHSWWCCSNCWAKDLLHSFLENTWNLIASRLLLNFNFIPFLTLHLRLFLSRQPWVISETADTSEQIHSFSDYHHCGRPVLLRMLWLSLSPRSRGFWVSGSRWATWWFLGLSGCCFHWKFNHRQYFLIM